MWLTGGGTSGLVQIIRRFKKSKFYLMFLARFLGCVWFAVRPWSVLIECFQFLADYCRVRAASERVTRRGESFSRVRQNRASERKALLAECHSLNLFVTFTLESFRF